MDIFLADSLNLTEIIIMRTLNTVLIIFYKLQFCKYNQGVVKRKLELHTITVVVQMSANLLSVTILRRSYHHLVIDSAICNLMN